LSPDKFFIILIVPRFDGIVNGEKVLLFACQTKFFIDLLIVDG